MQTTSQIPEADSMLLEELSTLKEDIDIARESVHSGYLDPGEEYELKRQIRDMERRCMEISEVLGIQ